MKAPVALISSTIAPPDIEHYGGKRARFDPAVRLEQTCASIRSLLDLGISDIHVADNSGPNWRDGMERELAPATVHRFSHHQFRNLGISEVYMLLATLPRLPPDRPLIKLSGRYVLKRRLDLELGASDVVVRRWTGLRWINCYISTVAYAVRDAATYERFLRGILSDVFGFPSRIVGVRSLLRLLRNSLFPHLDRYPYDDPTSPIEHAAYRALLKGRFRVHAVDSLQIEGFSGHAGRSVVE